MKHFRIIISDFLFQGLTSTRVSREHGEGWRLHPRRVWKPHRRRSKVVAPSSGKSQSIVFRLNKTVKKYYTFYDCSVNQNLKKQPHIDPLSFKLAAKYFHTEQLQSLCVVYHKIKLKLE